MNFSIGHFRAPRGLCFKTRVGAQPLLWKSFFILTRIKLFFHKKGCAPSLILKVRGIETRKWPIDFSFIDSIFLFLVVVVVVFPLLFFLREKRFTINYQSRSACFKNICMNNVYLRFIVYAWLNLTCYDAPTPAIPPRGNLQFFFFPSGLFSTTELHDRPHIRFLVQIFFRAIAISVQ